MSIIIDENTRVLVQGITGNQGSFHTARMKEYGTNVVAGVTPGKGGSNVAGVPVYDSVDEAVRASGATAAIIFVPAPFAKDAVLEEMDAGLNPIVVITEGIPVHDSMTFVKLAEEKDIIIVGPNTPGIISAGKCKMGIMPNHIFKPGNVGIVSRSGTLTYEIAASITNSGLGQSTCLGVGGDPVTGMDFVKVLKLFARDDSTKAVVLIGEIGGTAEERAAKYAKKYKKPVVAFIAGRTAPKGKRMGHAGAIIGAVGSAEDKIAALTKANIKVAETPAGVAELVKNAIGGQG